MADLEKARKDPKEQFWEELEDVHAGMLGIERAGQHMQPMAPIPDPEGGRIWFFAHGLSDLVQSLTADGGHAHFVVVGEDHDYHASVTGQLKVNNDRDRIDEYWNSVVAAWYEHGKDDSNVTLLEMTLRDGAIWASSGSPLAFGWEIAKANITDDTPDVGVRNHLTF